MNLLEGFSQRWQAYRAKKSSDGHVGKAVVEKLTDQALLADIAMNAKSENVRLDAAKKLTDQALLARLAITAKSPIEREEAVKKVTDQVLLADIAKNTSDRIVGIDSVKNVNFTDQALLANVALEAFGYAAREAAAFKLTDQTLLAYIASRDISRNVRWAAVENKNLTDQTLLAELVNYNTDDWRFLAYIFDEKLTDQAVLANIANNASDAQMRKAAVEKLSDQVLLSAKAVCDSSEDVRKTAIKMLSIRNQDLLAEVALFSIYGDEGVSAVEKLYDIALLADVAENASDAQVRKGAFERRTELMRKDTGKIVLEDSATWYFAEDQKKKVRQVILEIPPTAMPPSHFASLMLGAKYMPLLTSDWVTGFFRLDNDLGPYLMIRARDEYKAMQNNTTRLCFSFYRMPTAGILAIFWDCPAMVGKWQYGHVEGASTTDQELGIDIILDAMKREFLELVFAVHSPNVSGDYGGQQVSIPRAVSDVRISIPEDFRRKILSEIEDIMSYQRGLTCGSNGREAMDQMWADNPADRSAILSRIK